MSGTTLPPATPSEPPWAKPSIGIYTLALLLACLGVSWWTKSDTAFNLIVGAVIANASTVINYYARRQIYAAVERLMGTRE